MRKDVIPDTLELWQSGSDRRLLCLVCEAGPGSQRINAVALIFCNGECQAKRPEYHFVDSMLADWRASGLTLKGRPRARAAW